MPVEPYTEAEIEEHLLDTVESFDEVVETAKVHAERGLKESQSTIAHPLATIDARALLILIDLYESLKPEVMDAEERELLEDWLEENDGKVIRVIAELDDGVQPNTVGEIGILVNDKASQKIRLRVGVGVSESGDVQEEAVEYNYDDIVSVQALWTVHWSKHGYSEA